MKVVLHIGAHRTGTTTLQRALYQNQYNFRKNNTVFWGPRTTRGGLFSGLLNADKSRHERNIGVIQIELARLKSQGCKLLIVSEENIIGSSRRNLREERLYPDLLSRLVRFQRAFEGYLDSVVLGIRSYEGYWPSALSFAIAGGHLTPSEDMLDRLVTQPRNWTRVISDISEVFRDVPLNIWDFEDMIGDLPAQMAILGADCELTSLGSTSGENWHNMSPSLPRLREALIERGDALSVAELGKGAGKYAPFCEHHIDAMRAQFTHDMAWLRKGADGKATFIEAYAVHPKAQNTDGKLASPRRSA